MRTTHALIVVLSVASTIVPSAQEAGDVGIGGIDVIDTAGTETRNHVGLVLPEVQTGNKEVRSSKADAEHWSRRDGDGEDADGVGDVRDAIIVQEGDSSCASGSRGDGDDAASCAMPPSSSSSSEQGSIPYDTEEHDGIKIEFVGTATGTLPEPSLRTTVTDQESQQHIPVSSLGAAKLDAGDGGASIAKEEGATEVELLGCAGESGTTGATQDGGLTLQKIGDNMLHKLMRSAKKVEPKVTDDAEGRREMVDGKQLTARSTTDESVAFVERAAVIATAPVFSALASIPWWFSEAVFEVSLKEGDDKRDLPQRLLLVHDLPRSLQLACAVLAPSPLVSTSASASISSPSSPSWFKRVMRKVCQLDSPFPGRIVSRPCYNSASLGQQSPTTTASSWSAGFDVQTALRLVGFGSGNSNSNNNIFGRRVTAKGGVSDGTASTGGSLGGCSCQCASGGAGPCLIHAPPGRHPCVYIDVARSKRWGHPKKRGAEATDASYGVETPTFRLALPVGCSSTAPSSSSMKTKSKTKKTSGPTGGSQGQGAREGSSSGGGGGVAARIWQACRAKGSDLFAVYVGLGEVMPSAVTVPTYVARLVMGLALLCSARPLSESRIFHYLLSALLGGFAGATAVLLRALGDPRRGFLRLLLVLGLLTWLALAAGGDLVPSPVALLAALPANMLAFWTSGFGRFHWAGKAFYAFSALAGVLITRWQGLFLDEGDGESSGNWLNGQVCIRRILTALAVFLVFSGVSDAEVGVFLVFAALIAPSVAHCARRYHMWINRSKCYRAGPMLSQSEYERQGDEYTRQAIEALRVSTAETWGEVRTQVKKQTRKRLHEFRKGGDHYTPHEEDRKNGGWCAIQ